MFTAVRERTREIGIFRAIGFRGSHIFTIVYTEAALISLAGGILGYHIGLIVTYWAGPLLTGTTLNVTWSPGLFALVAAVTMAAGGAAAALPARKAARIDPADALRFY